LWVIEVFRFSVVAEARESPVWESSDWESVAP
jgi:hypothetical protein